MSSPIILIVYIVFLFGGLFFILKNVVRLYKEVAKAEELLSAANTEAIEFKRQIDLLTVDAERRKVELEQKSAEAARKDAEVQQAAGEAKRCSIELQVKANELMIKEQEAQLLSVELEGLKNKFKIEGVKSAQYKDYDERFLKLKSEATQKDQELQTLKAELAKLQAGQQQGQQASLAKAEEIASKEKEFQRISGECQRLDRELQQASADAAKFKDALVKKDAELAGKEAEAAKAKAALDAKVSELAAKELEYRKLELEMGKLESVKAEYPAFDERIAKLRNAEGEIARMEKTLEDEKHSLRNVRMRAQESKMKLDLLGEKTKEAVESIATFAEGKEFEEFRKSIHMDETIRKYEDEIKHLKIQVIELEKKA
ncbi:MAG: hypothetical protein WCO69_00245 [Candidatus Omnitrophota bacterium]